VGTGTINLSEDQISASYDPISKTVYLGSSAAQSTYVYPVIHTVCPGVTPGDNELPLAPFSLFNIEFADNGQQQIIDNSQPGYKVKYTIVPL
jgi:hypothetical protein